MVTGREITLSSFSCEFLSRCPLVGPPIAVVCALLELAVRFSCSKLQKFTKITHLNDVNYDVHYTVRKNYSTEATA